MIPVNIKINKFSGQDIKKQQFSLFILEYGEILSLLHKIEIKNNKNKVLY
jgi:hypothetical protein